MIEKNVFILSLLLIPIVLSGCSTYAGMDYNNGLTRSIADSIYCKLTGCTITGNLTVLGNTNFKNITTVNYNFTGIMCDSTGACISAWTNITVNYYNKSESDNKYVPYTGASKNVDLGAHNINLIGSNSVHGNINGIWSDGITPQYQISANQGAGIFAGYLAANTFYYIDGSNTTLGNLHSLFHADYSGDGSMIIDQNLRFSSGYANLIHYDPFGADGQIGNGATGSNSWDVSSGNLDVSSSLDVYNGGYYYGGTTIDSFGIGTGGKGRFGTPGSGNTYVDIADSGGGNGATFSSSDNSRFINIFDPYGNAISINGWDYDANPSYTWLSDQTKFLAHGATTGFLFNDKLNAPQFLIPADVNGNGLTIAPYLYPLTDPLVPGYDAMSITNLQAYDGNGIVPIRFAGSDYYFFESSGTGAFNGLNLFLRDMDFPSDFAQIQFVGDGSGGMLQFQTPVTFNSNVFVSTLDSGAYTSVGVQGRYLMNNLGDYVALWNKGFNSYPDSGIAFPKGIYDIDSGTIFPTTSLGRLSIDSTNRTLIAPDGSTKMLEWGKEKVMDNIITNGNFTGSATSWTLTGSASYGSDKITFSGSGMGTLNQSSANMQTPLVVGKRYRLSVDIVKISGTQGMSTTCGGQRLLVPATTGTHIYDFTAENTDDLSFETGDHLTLDNVTLTPLSYNSVDIPVNLNVSGNATYNSFYSGMITQSFSGIAGMLLNSSYQITNFTKLGDNNGFSLINSNKYLQLINSNGAGEYSINWRIDEDGTANHNYQALIYINDIAQNNTWDRGIATASGDFHLDGFGHIRINYLDNVSLRISDQTGTSTPTIYLKNVKLERIGN